MLKAPKGSQLINDSIFCFYFLAVKPQGACEFTKSSLLLLSRNTQRLGTTLPPNLHVVHDTTQPETFSAGQYICFHSLHYSTLRWVESATMAKKQNIFRTFAPAFFFQPKNKQTEGTAYNSSGENAIEGLPAGFTLCRTFVDS